jgi:hypothetical protein
MECSLLAWGLGISAFFSIFSISDLLGTADKSGPHGNWEASKGGATLGASAAGGLTKAVEGVRGLTKALGRVSGATRRRCHKPAPPRTALT